MGRNGRRRNVMGQRRSHVGGRNRSRGGQVLGRSDEGGRLSGGGSVSHVSDPQGVVGNGGRRLGNSGVVSNPRGGEGRDLRSLNSDNLGKSQSGDGESGKRVEEHIKSE